MNYKVNLNLEIQGARVNPQNPQQGVPATFPIAVMALQILSQSRTLSEAKSLESLINKVKQGGEQNLTKDEFDQFYQRVVTRLSTESKIAFAEMLSANGVDYEAYETALPAYTPPMPRG